MKKRFDILDAWRSLSILLMVTYHFLYDLALFGVITWQQMFSTPLNILQKFICCSFIFLAGASARFSRNNLRHGLIGPGVYASHGYERSHIEGVFNSLKVLCGYLNV